jgi:hypothetical protein
MDIMLTSNDYLLEPGDRLELSVSPDVRSTGRLIAPEFFTANAVAIDRVEDERGQALRATYDPFTGRLDLPDWTLPENRAAVWLQYQGPGRFRVVSELLPPTATAELTTEQGTPIALEPASWKLVGVHGEHTASLPEWNLALRAARLATHAGFEKLICLPLVREMEVLEAPPCPNCGRPGFSLERTRLGQLVCPARKSAKR